MNDRRIKDGIVERCRNIKMIGRAAHMKRTPPRADDFATGDAAMRYFTPVEMPANNYRNLFEMPVASSITTLAGRSGSTAS